VRKRIEYRFRVPNAVVFTLYSYSKALEYRFRVPLTTGLACFAQKPSAKALPRAALGKEPSGNFETAKGSLPRALYRAHGKAFAEG
jgi:hypothetical protein